ncbi:MAG: ABC transporter ATP-binding protein [Alphaproteobacteria bacterium]
MIEVRALTVRFPGREKPAVSDVSFRVAAGEAFGLVGESGCGKTTVLRALAGLLAGWTGEIELAGRRRSPNKFKALPNIVQMVFQDPFGSLHPNHTIERVLFEPIAIHKLDRAEQRMVEALGSVGLPARFRHRLPHQLSGGERQRVAIARALILSPKILLLDEPTSALDVSVQAEVVNLLQQLRGELGLTYLLVSHDLPLVAHMCERCAVMRSGEIIEDLTNADLRAGKVRESYTHEFLAASRYAA